MAIDLSTPEGRSSYFNDKLEDLITGVDSTYGTIIFDELLKRIDKTIGEFNVEMEEIFDELKISEKNRQTVLRKLRKKQATNQESEEEQQRKDWEKKLKDLYGRDAKSEESKETEEGAENKEEAKK